jgi:hypothetical protein
LSGLKLVGTFVALLQESLGHGKVRLPIELLAKEGVSNRLVENFNIRKMGRLGTVPAEIIDFHLQLLESCFKSVAYIIRDLHPDGWNGAYSFWNVILGAVCKQDDG